MRKNPIFQAMSLVLRNAGKTLNVLRYGFIEKGWMRMTDLQHELKIFVGHQLQDPVLVDINIYVKTGDMPAAIDAARSMDPKEFPSEMNSGKSGVPIPPSVLDGLIDLLPAAATDDTRGCLKNVFVSRKNREAVATDGCILLLKKLVTVPKESFTVDPVTLKIADCFRGTAMGLVVSHRVSEKDASGKSSSDATFLTLHGNGWQLVSKGPDASEYPRYSKILPDRSTTLAVQWSDLLKTEIIAFLERIKVFTNQKTHMVYFTTREGIVKNPEMSYQRKNVFSKDIFALKPEQVIGVNAELLQTVLRFVGDQPVSVSLGDKLISPIVFQGAGCLALVMPLRTASSDTGISRTELLADESRKTVPMPAPEKGPVEINKAA